MIPSEVTQIASGGYHTLALTADKQVYGFGKHSRGQLGFKSAKASIKSSQKPVKVPLDDNLKVSEIYCGSLYSMAKTEMAAQE